MRLRYQELQGKPVLDVDGKKVGRVSDLVAEADGAALRITALRIGPAAVIRRISFRYFGLWQVAPREARWELVARIDEAIHLRVSRATLDILAADPGG